MKSIYSILCVMVLAITSCTKEYIELEPSGLVSPDMSDATSKMVTITARIGADASDTRVIIDGAKTEWEVGDVIYICKGYDDDDYEFSPEIIVSHTLTENELSEDKKKITIGAQLDPGNWYEVVYKNDYANSNYEQDKEYSQAEEGGYEYVADNIWLTTKSFYLSNDATSCDLYFEHRSTLFDIEFTPSSDINREYEVDYIVIELPAKITYRWTDREDLEYFKLNLAAGTKLGNGLGFRTVIPAFIQALQGNTTDIDKLYIHIVFKGGGFKTITKAAKKYEQGFRYNANIIIDEVVESSSILELNNLRAGELKDIFPESLCGFAVTNIKVTGALNSDDLLNLMLQYREAKHLDLSEAAFFENKLPYNAFYYEKFPVKGFLIAGGSSAYSLEHGYSIGKFETILLPDNLVEVGEFAFGGLKNLTKITFPESVKVLGEQVLNSCSSLKSVVLPSGVNTIPHGMFANSGLEEFVVPNNIEIVGSCAFSGCSLLEKFQFNTNVTKIDYGVLSGTAIKSIVIPSTVESITSSFMNCEMLEEVIFAPNSNLKAIYTYSYTNEFTGSYYSGSFENCTSLKHIDLPSGLQEISDETFKGSGLVSVKIPNSVVKSQRAFVSATELATVEFESNSNVETLSNSFTGCSSLQSINIPRSVKTLGSQIFADCVNLESVTFEDGIGINEISGLGSYSRYSSPFANTPRLKNIIIPESVTTIGSGTFADTSFEEIVIGSNVTTLGAGVFYNCSNLNTIKCYPSTPPTFIYGNNNPEDSFSGANPHMTLQVRTSAIDAYKANDTWSFNFNIGKNIIGGL